MGFERRLGRGEIVVKYVVEAFSSCQPFCLGMRRSPARVGQFVALWRCASYI